MLRRHLDLLVHACICRKPDCVPNCVKMRELLKHVHECPIKSQVCMCNMCVGERGRVWRRCVCMYACMRAGQRYSDGP